ncbi:exosortase [Candidatus Hydrogenedentota bacterium]
MTPVLNTANSKKKSTGSIAPGTLLRILPIGILMVVLYWQPIGQMRHIWSLAESYYSHGFLIGPVSIFLIWQKRNALRAIPVGSSPLLGYSLLVFASILLILGAFLGFAVFGHISLLPMLGGLVLTLYGKKHFRILAFPILFLVFMVPIPSSFTQSIALDLKLFATHLAVSLARLMTLPLIHDGSFVRFRSEFLLIGDVCGGLRSLISMLALGALMAYIGKMRLWARYLILALAVPVAIASNVSRILLLCVVGYFFGAKSAVGKVHDISGFFMFGLAFFLFYGFNSLLHRIAPESSEKETTR